jgi:hypothetical protein
MDHERRKEGLAALPSDFAAGVPMTKPSALYVKRLRKPRESGDTSTLTVDDGMQCT